MWCWMRSALLLLTKLSSEGEMQIQFLPVLCTSLSPILCLRATDRSKSLPFDVWSHSLFCSCFFFLFLHPVHLRLGKSCWLLQLLNDACGPQLRLLQHTLVTLSAVVSHNSDLESGSPAPISLNPSESHLNRDQQCWVCWIIWRVGTQQGKAVFPVCLTHPDHVSVSGCERNVKQWKV